VVVATVAAVLGALLTLTVALLDTPPTGPIEQLTRVLVILGGALFLGGGVLRTARWRVTGDQRSLLMGTALIVLGGLAIPLTGLAGVIMGADDRSMLRAATAVLTTGVAMTLVVRALVSRGDKQPHAVLVVAGSVAAAVALFATVLVVHASAPHLLHSESLPPKVVRGSLLAVAWLYVGLEATLRSEQRPWAGKVAPLLGCMGVAEVLRVVAAYYPDGIWELAGGALLAALAAITAHRALVDLDAAAGADRARQAVVAALHQPLRPTGVGEVAHLEHLLVRGDRGESVDFDVDLVVADVVAELRSRGVLVELDVEPARVHGRPADLTTALRNLLANVHDHGGGRAVVRTVGAPGRVEILVADDGPGLADGQVATLFERGPGLGLHVSRTLMRQQGGDLQLRGHHGGAAFALVLDAARAPAPSAGAEARWLDGRLPVSPCAG
jgi:signal transduction histidine kinase